MKAIGIICEYNPLHNGHIYHINKIKKKYPDYAIILVLNGYFLERGEISIINKEDKTILALKYGIDLVLELPFVFGSMSADIFANTSITILNYFKVEKIICGSEINDIKKIEEIARKQLNISFEDKIKSFLNQGINYPTALAKAIDIKFDYKPNDLLAISYVKSILKYNYPIKLETIKRTNDFHDVNGNEKIISASNIRKKIADNMDIKKYVPTDTINTIKKVDYNKLFLLLKYKIINADNLAEYVDVEEGIEYRIKKMIYKVNNYFDLVNQVKSKRYTYNKINRMFMHILIGLKKNDMLNYYPQYINILGFNQKGKQYLKALKKELSIPVSKNFNSTQYKYEMTASLIYDLITSDNSYEYELKNKPLYF